MRKIDISWLLMWLVLFAIWFMVLDYALDKTFDYDTTTTTEQLQNEN